MPSSAFNSSSKKEMGAEKKPSFLFTFASKGMGVILLCPMHLVTVK
jgi:hypothetical protein